MFLYDIYIFKNLSIFVIIQRIYLQTINYYNICRLLEPYQGLRKIKKSKNKDTVTYRDLMKNRIVRGENVNIVSTKH